MNSLHIYIFFAVIILISAFIGYKAGFLRTALFIFKVTAAFVAAYFVYSYTADLFITIFPSINESLFPASFFTSFFILYCIMLLVFIPVSKLIRRYRFSVVNRIAGIIPGIVCGAIATVALMRCALFFSFSGEASNAVQNNEIVMAVNPAAEWVGNKLKPVFYQQLPEPAVAAATEKIIPEQASVKLSFVTYSYEIRSDLEGQMLQMVNDERVKYGLKKLLADMELAEVSRQHSADMFNRGYFSHNTPDSINPFQRMHNAGIIYRVAGENLALSSTLVLAHKGLMNSPRHRANILNPMYGRIGIGILDAGKYGLMVTQSFRD